MYRWSENVVLAAERDLKQVKGELRAANRQSSLAKTVEEQMEVQESIRGLEKKKRDARLRIFDTEDEIEEKRDSSLWHLRSKWPKRPMLKHSLLYIGRYHEVCYLMTRRNKKNKKKLASLNQVR